MASLSDLEVFALTGIVASGENAYAVPIFEEIEKLVDSSREVSLGSLYVTLDRLEKKGFVRSWYSEPLKERGGRSRRYFEITAAGGKALTTTLVPMRRAARTLDSCRKATS